MKRRDWFAVAGVMLVLVLVYEAGQRVHGEKKSVSALDPKWLYYNARLSKQDRQDLADMTPNTTRCQESTWNDTQLWWECDFDSKQHGPRAILPMSAARAQDAIDREDGMWCDPDTAFGMTVNTTFFKCAPNDKSPHADRKGRWEEDVVGMKRFAEHEAAKWRLFRALSERKLTHDELMHCYEGMNVTMGQSYFQVDVDADMYDALIKQWELQTGQKATAYVPLSRAKGQYNRSPQEEDNTAAVKNLLAILQKYSAKYERN